jgi:hypoxanthine-guanine phosphoribosyltransferase
MSKNETPMTEWYWREILKKGTLIKEYIAVERTKDGSNASRYLDGLVILDDPFEISDDVRCDIAGKDVVIIQSKNKQLGMYLMGQALFSRELILKKKPKSVRSVAVCRKDDKVMRPLLEAHPGIEVAFCPAEVK